MRDFLSKTFGGLNPSYYIRHLIFGIIIALCLYYALSHGVSRVPILVFVLLAINTLLYPYSRFVYESIVGFILGNNVFFFSGKLFLISFLLKLWMMLLCWAAAIIIAPLGLIYLYFYHSRRQN